MSVLAFGPTYVNDCAGYWGVCLSKTSKCLRGRELYFSHHAHFAGDRVRHFVCDLPFALRTSVGKLGAPTSNRRAAAFRGKEPQHDSSGPPLLGLAIPGVAGLALSARYRSTPDSHRLAPCWLSAFLDLEGAAWPVGTPRGISRGSRSDPQDVP